ncbi:MAG: hypothetical protein HY054_01610, partial [Proteobacteria bacterium]|nr:hypothetical protein [Pseudomonadota bacterium]
MNPDEEEPKPAPEDPAPESSAAPTPNEAEAASVELSPSDAEAHEAAPLQAVVEPESAPELEPKEPEPELVASAPPPFLREPLAPAFDQHGADALDEPMSDDAFLRRRGHGEPEESLFGTPETQPDIRFPGEGRARGPRVR